MIFKEFIGSRLITIPLIKITGICYDPYKQILKVYDHEKLILSINYTEDEYALSEFHTKLQNALKEYQSEQNYKIREKYHEKFEKIEELISKYEKYLKLFEATNINNEGEKYVEN